METISSVADARQAQMQYAFKIKVEELRDKISTAIEELDSYKGTELEEANNFLKKEMQKLLEVPIDDEESLEEVEWYFNNGNLRTEEEVEAREKARADAEYIQSGKYESDCFSNKCVGGICGFILGFILPLIFVEDFRNPGIFVVFGWLVCGFVGCIFMLIGFALASSTNIDIAKEHNVPANHPRYKHDRRELGLCGISSVISTGVIAHKASKTMKDIANVDGWKEMK